MAQEYDKLIKENIAAIFPSLSKRYLGIEVIKNEPIREKLQRTVERETDFLQKVLTAQGEELIVHLEFQSTDHPKMLERMRLYHALIGERYDLPIRQFVIYLGQQPSKMHNQLPPSKVFNGYQLIEIQALDYQPLLESDIPEEIILAILGNFKSKEAHIVLAKIIGRLQELIDVEATLQKYISHLLTLARLRNLFKITQETLNTMAITYDIKKDDFYKKGRKAGIEEGEKKGMERGMEKGIEKGMEKGMEKGILQTALNMKKAGFSTEDIMKVTNLNKEQIEQL
ncbi:hypothetical protein [uncultured Microscilla sp.]|uniref:hypothetical protein n=1 Tax=uncultured Microscilla sp. TaxID=432653 RepID=UPI002622D9D3|nr:hypothetical protein [uncultured Microscilla sp.]